ncbi:hypothetical protein Tco_0885012 [Tanacetum coccineum]
MRDHRRFRISIHASSRGNDPGGPREQELLAQKQAPQEKEEPPQNSDFRQLVGEMCGTKVFEEQKQKLKDTMLELLEDCRQKEIYCMHNDVKDLIGITLESKLLSIKSKSQRLVQEQQEVKNIFEPAAKLIKSSVKNLVPIPSESEVTSNNESECDVLVNDESSLIFTIFSNPLFDSNDDFTFSDDELLSDEDVQMENFKIYSNPLFDNEENISTKIDPHYFNAESNLIESLLNRDTLIDSSPKFDYLLEEFSGELAHIDPIPPGIEEVDFDLEEEIRLVENFDSRMEEIDLFLASDELMLSGIENDDYDSEEDIHFIKELLSNDPLSLPKNESSNFDHRDDRSFPRPPPDTLLPFSSKNEDKVFNPGILTSHFLSHRDKIIFDFSKSPMMIAGGEIPHLDVPFLHFYLP